MTTGTTISVLVRNMIKPLYDWSDPSLFVDHDLFTGTVVERPWVDRRWLIALQVDGAVRVIKMQDVIELNSKPYRFVPPISDIVTKRTVASSNGKSSYVVTSVNGKPTSCTCPGFGFRRDCKHLRI